MSKPSKYFILCKNSDDDSDDMAYFEPVMATAMTYRGFHLIVHESKGELDTGKIGWRVSEMITGKNLVMGHESEVHAREAARKKIDAAGPEELIAKIYHNAERFGVSPRYYRRAA